MVRKLCDSHILFCLDVNARNNTGATFLPLLYYNLLSISKDLILFYSLDDVVHVGHIHLTVAVRITIYA